MTLMERVENKYQAMSLDSTWAAQMSSADEILTLKARVTKMAKQQSSSKRGTPRDAQLGALGKAPR